MRGWLIVLVCALFSTATTLDAQMRVRSRCGVCHSELEFLRQNTDSMTAALAVHVADSTVAASAHGELACTACHSGFDHYPHSRTLTKPCAECHAGQNEAWLRSAHLTQADKSGAVCAACHNVHGVLRADELKTRTGMLAMNRNCVGCHQTQKLGVGSPHADSMLCSSCHGAHDTKPGTAGDARGRAAQQLQSCGVCHRDVASMWSQTDIHAEALLTRRPHKQEHATQRPPACTDCHGAHGINVAPDSTLVQAAYERCAECHDHYAGAYADSYHGQATELGSQKAAACADCHTAHAIQPADNPRSSVAKANLIATCRACHPNASASFTKFDAHVDPHDRTDNAMVFWSYKFMTLLLIGVMSFFGLHTALWLNRLAIERARERRRGGAKGDRT